MKFYKLAIVVSLCIALPTSQLFASVMIGTEQVVADMATERERVQAFINRGDVQKKLVEMGVSASEANQRVASLSDAEIKKVAGHLNQMRAGGDGIYVGIGGLILLILLIYIIVRR